MLFRSIEPFLQGGILIPFFGKALLKLPVAHAIIPLLSLFTKNSEIKDHLARTVGNGKKQSFETKNTLVMNVGVNSSDVFNAPSGLGIVRIINYQTGSAFLMVCADSYLIPQLNVWSRPPSSAWSTSSSSSRRPAAHGAPNVTN